jgi:hypothetical protein
MTAIIKKMASTGSRSSLPDNPKKVSPGPSRARLGRRRVMSIVGMIAIAAIVLATFHQSISSAQGDGSTPESSPVASPVTAATPDADAQKLTVTFTEYNDSGIKGTATFYDEGTRTLVVIDVKNAGKDHPAQIHAGTCNNLDPKAAYNLIDIHENGESSTFIDTTLNDLTASQFAIDLHLSPNDLGTMIACANITGSITNAQGTPVAPATPVAVATEETPATAVGGDGTSGSSMPTPTQVAGMGDNTTTEITPTAGAVSGETPEVAPTEPASAQAATTPTQAPAAVIVTGNETPTAEAIGGDGTGAGTVWTSTNTSSALGTTGTGPAEILVPNGPVQAAILASMSFALILFLSGVWVWRGEQRQTIGTTRKSTRWSRLGM